MKRHVAAAFIAIALFVHTYVAQAFRPAQQPVTTIEDEYVRYELLDPSTHSFRIARDVSVVTPGATSYVDAIPVRAQVSDVSVIDAMTGAPLTVRPSGTGITITLARPVPKGGQARLRILMTLRGAVSYRESGSDIVFEHPSSTRRAAVVLPRGFEVIKSSMPVQVIQETDGRIAASFMSVYPVATTVVEIRARALKNPPAAGLRDDASNGPRPSQATADAPPPAQPMDLIRVNERAIQDREIVYFLKQPETHAFSLYHDYTASREGEHQYVNVVRAGSTVSDPSAVILDTGEELKTRVLTGADIAREKIEIDERVDPDTHVVLIPFTPVKKGTSVRLRISETYTDPARYALINGQLMWHRSFGRNRNDMLLPDGWYLTTSSIPAVVSQEQDGRIRLSFWNGRPDNVDVFVKGSRR